MKVDKIEKVNYGINKTQYVADVEGKCSRCKKKLEIGYVEEISQKVYCQQHTPIPTTDESELVFFKVVFK